MECLEKMSFTSHFKKLLILFICIIVVIEFFVRIIPIYYFDKPEKFLIHFVRKKIESGQNNYDVIILGDSRSMSLNPGTYKNVYNFSLPGMGSRYYPYFIKKYLSFNNKKPKAIIFAGSPLLVFTGKGEPVVHSSLKRYVKPDMSIFEYIYNRTVYRIMNLDINDQKFSYNREELLWDFFSHRLLFLFSTIELAKQYTGVERVYVLSESIPLNYSTYKFRDAIKNLFELNNYKTFKNYFGEAYCSCNNLLLSECQPSISQLQDNIKTEILLNKNNGYLNISDRLSPRLREQYSKQKENIIKIYKAGFDYVPKFDFSYTKEFIEYLNQNNILYIYLLVPFPSYFTESKELQAFQIEFEKFLSNFPNTKIFYFPTRYFDPDLYSDQVHLTCEGAEKLNIEFQEIVLPRILEYVNEYYSSSSHKK